MKNHVLILMFLMINITPVYADADAREPSDSLSQMIIRKASQTPVKGAASNFTGDVTVNRLFPASPTAQYAGAYVTFEPGARSAWHSHPAGQHMIIISGVALTGTRDGKVIEARPGDVVWCPPDLDHWHGASPDTAMTHLVITGVQDGKNSVWKEQVSDEQYKEGQ